MRCASVLGGALCLAAVLSACTPQTSAPASAGETASRTERSGRQRRLPPPPTPFNSTGCQFFKASYEPHPAQDPSASPHRYSLRFQFDSARPAEGWAILQARDRRTDAPVTTLRLQHTTSAGIANQYLHSHGTGINAQMEELNRDLSFGTQGRVRRGEWLAPYAILLTDLGRDLYYLHGDWDELEPYVTYHTPERVKPLFPNMWMLSNCG